MSEDSVAYAFQSSDLVRERLRGTWSGSPSTRESVAHVEQLRRSAEGGREPDLAFAVPLRHFDRPSQNLPLQHDLVVRFAVKSPLVTQYDLLEHAYAVPVRPRPRQDGGADFDSAIGAPICRCVPCRPLWQDGVRSNKR